MVKTSDQTVIKIISAVCLIFSIALCIYGWKTGIFTSQEKLQTCIASFGSAGVIIFTLFQAVQVVVPVLPGGLGCLAGVLMFGSWNGFIYNYIGICAGSILAFLVAKYYGKPLLSRLFSEKQLEKYEKWTTEKDRFAKLFALAIFLPVAPDDFLCYLAGTTEMKLSQFTAITLLCKPFGIAMYSLGLTAAFSQLTTLIGG